MPNNLDNGGYTEDAVVNGLADHGDPDSPTYRRDQIIQDLNREEEAKWSPRRSHRAQELNEAIKGFEFREARVFAAKYAAGVEGLKAVHNRDGRAMSIPERRELLRGMAKTRGRYKRPDGRGWVKLRCYKTFVENGKKVRRDVAPKVIWHTAIQDGPILSLMLVKAAQHSPEMLALARGFNAAAVPAEVELVERLTGMEVVDDPYHPKPLGGHGQVHLVGVDGNGKKLKSWGDQVHLGRKLLGALMLMDMGIVGAELDAHTGVPDSEAGIKHADKQRGGLDRCIDVRLQRERQKVREKLLEEPRFAPLLQFHEAAKVEYGDYLARRRAVIAGAVADLAREAGEMEALKKRLELEVAGADMRVRFMKEAKAETDAKLDKAEAAVRKERAEKEQFKASANKQLREFGEKANAHAQSARAETKKARSELDAVKAELAVRQAAQVVVRANGREWPVPQAQEAMERMSWGKGTCEDELLLNEHGAVDIGVIRQLAAFAKLPDIQTAGAAEAALEHNRKFGVRRRTQLASGTLSVAASYEHMRSESMIPNRPLSEHRKD